jgi:hypothetical protein
MAVPAEVPDLDLIETASDFGCALQALRERSGLTIRDVARLADGRVATVGDYFSGRHMPLDRELFARVLIACGEDDPARIGQWQLALARARRLPGRRGRAPYRGLARYEEADAKWFFGREDVTRLLASLASEPSELPLVLIGPSGAGKSSVLRAGLLPQLDGNWSVTVVDLPVTGIRELTEAAVTWTAKVAPTTTNGDGKRQAVVVDQFEAVFTLCADDGERSGLIGALCELARQTLVRTRVARRFL